MSEDEKQCYMRAVQNTPWQQIEEQIRFLDRALNTIPEYGCEETKLVRNYLIAQIEALKWARKLHGS